MNSKKVKIEGVYCTTPETIKFLVDSRRCILSKDGKYIYRILSPNDITWTRDWDDNVEMFQYIYRRDFDKPDNYIDPKKRGSYNVISKYYNYFNKPVLTYEQMIKKLKYTNNRRYKKSHDLDDYMALVGNGLNLDEILVGYEISYEDPSVVAKKTEENIFSDGMTTHFRKYR